MNRDVEKILDEQKSYYRQRAYEYDEWFFRTGRYDRGEKNNADWFNEIELVKRDLGSHSPFGEVLELAAGTGLWTGLLKEFANQILAVDFSPEVLKLNSERNGNSNVQYTSADIFSWVPDKKYDFVFFSFWLSHVPEEKFEQFWNLVKASLKPSGRWYFIDSRPDDYSRAIDHSLDLNSDVVKRKLNDGGEFEIIKRFYEPESLTSRLQGLGWDARITASPRFFIYGSGIQVSRL